MKIVIKDFNDLKIEELMEFFSDCFSLLKTLFDPHGLSIFKKQNKTKHNAIQSYLSGKLKIFNIFIISWI